MAADIGLADKIKIINNKAQENTSTNTLDDKCMFGITVMLHS